MCDCKRRQEIINSQKLRILALEREVVELNLEIDELVI
jgi:hypothetical protein